AIFAWHGLRYPHGGMRRSSSPESAPPQGRRIAIALLILLLIALPLYLWPLRGSGTGLPGAATHSGLPRDPRDASALAHIPADVADSVSRRPVRQSGLRRRIRWRMERWLLGWCWQPRSARRRWRFGRLGRRRSVSR